MERSSIAGIVITLVIAVALLALVYWLVSTKDVDVNVAISLIGVIGTAATIATLVYVKSQVRKANFAISRAAITFKGDMAKGYILEASLINEGDEPDVLRQIDHQLYYRRLGFIESNLICGGSPITQDEGHILPIECLPRKLYRIYGYGGSIVWTPIYDRLTTLEQLSDYVLRCTFVFAIAKPITIWVSRDGLIQKWPPLLNAQELLLRLKGRNKNPFIHNRTT